MKFFIIVFIILVIMLLFVILESIRENRMLKIAEYEIASSKIPEGLSGKKAAYFSDYHNALNGKNNEKILRMIEEAEPEMVLVGGDMIIGKEGENTKPASWLLNELARRYPVYYGKGNHEKRAAEHPEAYGSLWEDYRGSLDESILYLEDMKTEYHTEGGSIVIYGLDLDRFYYKRFFIQKMDVAYLNDKLGIPDENRFNILLAHNPDYFPRYAEWGADLTLSGHVHGGLVRLPLLGGVISPRIALFPRYDRGLFEEKDRKMILSSGIGQHSLKIRVWNKPEIVLIRFRKI